MEPAPVVLDARGLTRTYRMGEVEVQALRGVDLQLRAGELVVLLGVSGSGKSTLLNLLGGLDVPTSGTLVWRDHDLSRADDRALTRYRREHVGFVFQFYNLVPSLTARENVALVTDIADRPLDPDDALALVGLAHRREFEDLRSATSAWRTWRWSSPARSRSPTPPGCGRSPASGGSSSGASARRGSARGTGRRTRRSWATNPTPRCGRWSTSSAAAGRSPTPARSSPTRSPTRSRCGRAKRSISSG
jgi:ABC-type sugar transport system ATPase subunit